MGFAYAPAQAGTDLGIAVTCASAPIRPSPAPSRANLPTARAVVPIRPLGHRLRDAAPVARRARDIPHGSLGQADAQRLLQLHYPTRGRTHRAPDSRDAHRPPHVRAVAEDLRSPVRADVPFGDDARLPSPVEEGLTEGEGRTLRAATTSPRPPRPRCKNRERERPRRPPPGRDAACGQRLAPTTVCGGGCRRVTIGRAGRWPRE